MYHDFPGFVDLAETPHGLLMYPRGDRYVGRSLKEYGEFSAGELGIFEQIVAPGSVVLDIGANLGAHTVPLARLTGPSGVVVAFEPQRILFQILCGNLAMNSLTNVFAHPVALGRERGSCRIPFLDYGSELNFGGLEIDRSPEGETVSVVPLDQFRYPKVDVIKLDVEGFEQRVLEGAADTLDRCKPILYLENDRRERSADLIRHLFGLGYRLWWHTPPLFHADNFRKNPEDVFPGIVSVNMIAIHRSLDYQMDTFPEVLEPTAWFTDAGDASR